MALPPLRERRTVRVLRIVGFFTLEDLRWMIRVDNDSKFLAFEPSDFFWRLEKAMVDALNGKIISAEDEHSLKEFIQGDKHWTRLFREEIMPNYPVIRTANKIVSGRLTGGEMYFQWNPDEFFRDLKYETRDEPLFQVWPHETIPFKWQPNQIPFTQQEIELLNFYGRADLDYVFRMPPMKGFVTNFPMAKEDIVAELADPDNFSREASDLLQAMFKNDVVIWRIGELKLGRLLPVSNIVWPWGQKVYKSEGLNHIIEKLMAY